MSSGSAASVEESPQSDDRLPAPDPATATAPALGLDDHVAELAGVPLPAAQRPAGRDDPAADADLGEEDQDVLAIRVAGGGLGEGGQVALVLDGDRVGVTEPGPEEVTDRHVVPAEVGSKGEHVALTVDQAGDTDGQSERLDVPVREIGLGLADQLSEPVEHLLGGDGPGVEAELVLTHHLAAEVEGHRRDVVDVDLGAEPGHGMTVELDARARTTDRAALQAAGADQPSLSEVRDQRRDRRPGHAELRGECRPRAGPVVTQPPQDQAEVGTSQGQLVGTEASVGGVERPHRPHLRSPQPCDRSHYFVSALHKLSG